MHIISEVCGKSPFYLHFVNFIRRDFTYTFHLRFDAQIQKKNFQIWSSYFINLQYRSIASSEMYRNFSVNLSNTIENAYRHYWFIFCYRLSICWLWLHYNLGFSIRTVTIAAGDKVNNGVMDRSSVYLSNLLFMLKAPFFKLLIVLSRCTVSMTPETLNFF